jgi:hypothetical protein
MVAAIGGGIVLAVAPSAGHIYVGQVDRVVGMSLVRAAGLGLQLAGTLQFAQGVAANFGLCDDDPKCETNHDNVGSGLIVMLAGAVVYTLGTALDLRDAPRAARRHNARRRDLMIAPGYARTPAGDGVPTVGLAGRF